MLPRHSAMPHPHHRQPRNSLGDRETILRLPCQARHLRQSQHNEASAPPSIRLPPSSPIDITNEPPPQVFLRVRQYDRSTVTRMLEYVVRAGYAVENPPVLF